MFAYHTVPWRARTPAPIPSSGVLKPSAKPVEGFAFVGSGRHERRLGTGRNAGLMLRPGRQADGRQQRQKKARAQGRNTNRFQHLAGMIAVELRESRGQVTPEQEFLYGHKSGMNT